jgi:parvulin-like peptidyl-prolyl isomerase
MSRPTTVRAAHLLIKHTGSRNPVSRRTGESVTLSPELALQELKSYETKIQQEGIQTSFAKYAKERSDCSSYSRNGDLGDFGPGMMQKPFEDASFALQPGEMSGIVDTDSGYHLIYRIA